MDESLATWGRAWPLLASNNTTLAALKRSESEIERQSRGEKKVRVENPAAVCEM